MDDDSTTESSGSDVPAAESRRRWFSSWRLWTVIGLVLVVGVTAGVAWWPAPHGDPGHRKHSPGVSGKYRAAEGRCASNDWGPIEEGFDLSNDKWLDDLDAPTSDEIHNSVGQYYCTAMLPLKGLDSMAYPSFTLSMTVYKSASAAAKDFAAAKKRAPTEWPELSIYGPSSCPGLVVHGYPDISPSDAYGKISVLCGDDNSVMTVNLEGVPIDRDKSGKAQLEKVTTDVLFPMVENAQAKATNK